MENLIGTEDYAIFQEGLMEVSSLVDKQVAIKRNSGFTGGTYDGTSPAPTYTYFYLMANIENVTDAQMTMTGGELMLGDIQLTTQADIRNVGEGGGGYTLQQGDVLVYDGYEYTIWGNPNRVFLAGGLAYTRSFWKKR